MRNRTRSSNALRNAIDSLEARRLMATFTVTNTLDSGAGSLRWAIDQANATTAADVINFNVGSGGIGISLQSSLTISRPVTIDATTQPGYAGVPLVRLNDGNNVGFGISITSTAQDSVLRGLSITGFGNPNTAGDGDAITVGAPNATIEKCYIGLRPDGGTTANEGDGVYITSGGTFTKLYDNVISGNGGDGVAVYGVNATLSRNVIGLNPAGTATRPNGGNGVLLRESNATVGWDAAQRNVISGNTMNGIRVWNPNANGIRIFGNYIGVSSGGNAKFANGDYGVRIDGSANVTVGANSDLANRFGGDGVILTGNSQNCSITANTFGIGVNSVFDVGDSVGVNIDSGSYNVVASNIVGRLDTGIRMAGFKNVAKLNYVGITPDGAAIPNVLGITTQGSSSTVEQNAVANNTNYGVWAVSGSGHSLENRAWDNGQSVWVSSTANPSVSVPTINSIVEQANGSYKVTVTADAPTLGGSYRILFFQNDAAGNAISGDTDGVVGPSIDFTANGSLQTFTTTMSIGNSLVDGRYLTAVLAKRVSQFSSDYSETSQPSKSVAIVGSPSVLSSSFDFETQLSWSFTFSRDVGASITADDLRLINYTTGATYTASAVTWDAATRTARWTRTQPLPDGECNAVLDQGKFATAAGVSNKAAYSQPFFVLAGDANRDRKVNFDDLLVLASNYNTTGKTFSQGNFNYDANGKVNFDDLLILAANYNKSLAGTPAPLVAPATPPAADDNGLTPVGDLVLA
jgi:hypothetical protein